MVTVEGVAAKDGTNMGNARVVVLAATGKRLFAASSQTEPPASALNRSGQTSIDRLSQGDVDVRNHLRGALLSSMIAILFTAFLGARRSSPPPSRRPAAADAVRPGPPQPTPRLADGTPNLGRVPGEKGVWNVPYITNMGERIIEADGKTHVEKTAAGGPAARRGRRRPRRRAARRR